MEIYDLLNKTFGHLTVVSLEHIKDKRGRNNGKLWCCTCICGKTRKVLTKCLLNGEAYSCGCKKFSSKIHPNKKYEPTEASYRAKVSNYKSLQ